MTTIVADSLAHYKRFCRPCDRIVHNEGLSTAWRVDRIGNSRNAWRIATFTRAILRCNKK